MTTDSQEVSSAEDDDAFAPFMRGLKIFVVASGILILLLAGLLVYLLQKRQEEAAVQPSVVEARFDLAPGHVLGETERVAEGLLVESSDGAGGGEILLIDLETGALRARFAFDPAPADAP